MMMLWSQVGDHNIDPGSQQVGQHCWTKVMETFLGIDIEVTHLAPKHNCGVKLDLRKATEKNGYIIDSKYSTQDR